jgi:8-oxo-dGTP pyrophosphatase MutT (NUDIX family)
MIKLKDILMWEQKVSDTAGIILRNETAGIVLCKEDEWWGIPKGRVDPGETPLEAAVREVLEEVSILLSPYGSHVNEPVELKTVANNSRGGNFYIFKCYVKLPMVLTKSAEHEAVGWFMTHRNMPDNIDPRIKGLI